MRLCRAITTFLFLTIIMSIVPSVVSSSIAQANIANYGEISYGDIPPLDGSLSRLHISGNKIVNEYGQQVFLRGVDHCARNYWHNLDGAPAKYSQGQKDQYRYMKEWGATSVMLSVFMPPFSTEWTSAKLDALEAQVGYAEDNGLYVQVDGYESYNVGWIFGTWGESDWTTWKNAWKDIATRLKGRTNVLYGIAVEPAGISAQTYVQRLRECIDGIRAIDPDVIIICEGLSVDDWYDDGLNFQRTIGVNRPNLIFDLHKYYFLSANSDTSYSSVLNMLESQGALWCLNNGFPVISQQCGFDSRNSNGATWFRNLLQVYADYGIHYTAWIWGTYQISGEWLNLNTDWYGNPSVQGLVLQKYLQTSN